MQKRRFTHDTAHGSSWTQTDQLMYGHRLQRLLVGRSIILYSQRTIKVLIKLSGMICTFIVGISQKRESVILILIYGHRLQRLLVGRSIILYSQRTIKVLIKLSGMICTFIVGISQKRESVILILILFGTYDMYIMVYKSSNYKQ